MIQSHTPVVVGTGTPFNQIGAWHLLIAEVTAASIWSQLYSSRTTNAPSGTVMQGINLELGTGALGEEIRRWDSIFLENGGSALEFDDSWFSIYLPFTFPKGARISARAATLGSVVQVHTVQLQLYS